MFSFFSHAYRVSFPQFTSARAFARLLLRFTMILAAVALLTAVARGAENWPEFRGPSGDGHADATGLPIQWSESRNVKWKTAIHDKGWSSPVIWGNQIWLTTATEDGKQLFVLCVDRDTGKIVHDVKLFDVEKPGFCPPTNSYASPTPVVEEGRVYVHFGSYGTACLNTATAQTIWCRQDLPCDHWRAPGSSPILHGDLLFIDFDGYDQQYVVSLEKRTGKTRWKRSRDIDYGTTNGDLKKAYATPAIAKVNGSEQLVCPSAIATIAYEPATGRELWKVYHGGMNTAMRPVFGDGLVFVSAGETGPIRLVAVRPDGHGDITRSHVAWKMNQGVPARSSLILAGELLFMANERGLATCLEARTGVQVWQRRMGGEHTASPVYADGRIYFLDVKGAGHVVSADREGQVLARNQLDEGCMASPAIVGKALYVRTKTHLYRIEQGARLP